MVDELVEINYEKNNFIQDVIIKIDLEDILILLFKIIVDYSILIIGNVEDIEIDVIILR